MAKALKIVGLVVGAAVLAVATAGTGLALALGTSLTSAVGFGVGAVGTLFGVSAGTLLLGAAALSTIGSALSNPQVPSSQTDRLTASIDPRAFRKTALGQTALATDIRYEEWSGKDQEYCDWIVANASHAIDGVEEIWLDQEMAWSATTGVTSKYVGYFSVPNIVLEGSPASAFTFGSGKWNQSARLTGCAYVRLRFKTTGNSKKAESPFSSSIPTRITIIGRGAKLYDPRRDSTVPGGSGPMRWNDQSTWRYTTDDGAVIGENLALQILRVVLGWRIRNPDTGEMRLATGSGVPGRRLDLVAFQVAANLCDELVNRSAGGNEPRYHGAGVISEGDDPKQVLDMLCAACCGRFRDTGGKLALVIAHNDLAAAAADDGLHDDDVIGGFTWDPDPSLEATPNVARGRYVDASSASLYQLIDYPEVRIASLDGQDRIMTLDLGVVESPSQAQRIVKQALERRQYQRSFSAPFDIRAWKYTVGDVVPFTFAALSFTRALFRVAQQELGQDGTCNMTLSVEHPVIYSWDASDAPPVLAADPIVYDSRNNPLILAIDDAAKTATEVVFPGAAIGGTKNPDGSVSGGLPAKTTIDALAELAGTPDASTIVDRAKASVARARSTIASQLAAQLLGEDRKARYERLLHLDGVELATRVVHEITERKEGDTAIVERVDLIEATASDGIEAAQAAIREEASVRASADEAETAQREEAVSTVLAAVDGERLLRESEIVRVETTAANDLDAATSQLETAISTVEVAVGDERVDRQAALAGERTTSATELAAATSELFAAISTVETLLDGERLDREAAITDERHTSADALSAATSQLQAAISSVEVLVDGERQAREAAITDERNTSASETGALAHLLTLLGTQVGENEASIMFLLETTNGEQAIAQLSVNVNGEITGFKINGQEKLFVVAAERFVVGNSQIFEVDTVTGEVSMDNVVVSKIKARTIDTAQLRVGAVTDSIRSLSSTTFTGSGSAWIEVGRITISAQYDLTVDIFGNGLQDYGDGLSWGLRILVDGVAVKTFPFASRSAKLDILTIQRFGVPLLAGGHVITLEWAGNNITLSAVDFSILQRFA
ncbi:hypothetical protein AWL63_19010 [Sphingomonas panacis]|uniref:Tip attachment protein J domain-containing protein n=1 Tax=Sphingomonas panacis TaxID=1560345 RepID=A0A1B3ZE70_9SPHN|nr:hypothetical protein [Sphingomonas panacis]AOH85720.1 hypothetical protein AWL63_19010 [Sphingomonas panacis]